jgi:hypothetical protein
MFDRAERYGHSFVKLTDSGVTEKEFEFDQTLLMPTVRGRRRCRQKRRSNLG